MLENKKNYARTIIKIFKKKNVGKICILMFGYLKICVKIF